MKTNPIDTYIRIVVISILIYWSFLIFKPFLVIMMWAMIIAVAFYPLFVKAKSGLKGRSSLAAGLISLVLVLLILIPSIEITGSIVNTAKDLKAAMDDGTLKVDPPNQNIQEWPVVGKSIYAVWYKASENLEKTLTEYKDEVSKVVSWLYNSVAGLFTDVLFSLVSIMIAGVLLHFSEPIYQSTIKVFSRLAGEEDKGKEYTDSSRDTIRSVVKGLVLIALIQGILSGIGFALADIPGAGLWAIVVILLAIVQLPVILLMIPMIIYVFSNSETWVAIVFTVFALVVGSLDNFLKPILLGRGLTVPMPVILIGAIGGMILHGLIGLFIGPVVLAIAWQVYQVWLDQAVDDTKTDVKS